MSSMKGDDTRNAIKQAAQRLFATRGIDGVSVREIASAANQRNSGSVHYYFGTKEALVGKEDGVHCQGAGTQCQGQSRHFWGDRGQDTVKAESKDEL